MEWTLLLQLCILIGFITGCLNTVIDHHNEKYE